MTFNFKIINKINQKTSGPKSVLQPSPSANSTRWGGTFQKKGGRRQRLGRGAGVSLVSVHHHSEVTENFRNFLTFFLVSSDPRNVISGCHCPSLCSGRVRVCEGEAEWKSKVYRVRGGLDLQISLFRHIRLLIKRSNF